MFKSYLRQDLTFYDQPEHTTGSLVSHLSTKPTSLQELLGFNIGIIITALVNIVSSSILALAVGWKLGLVVLAGAMIPMVSCGYLRIRLEFMLDEGISTRFSQSAALAGEAVSAIRTVVSLAIERTILSRYTSELAGIERRSIKSLIWTMFWLSLTQSLSFLSMALSFWYLPCILFAPRAKRLTGTGTEDVCCSAASTHRPSCILLSSDLFFLAKRQRRFSCSVLVSISSKNAARNADL